jgi:hypothetical protein
MQLLVAIWKIVFQIVPGIHPTALMTEEMINMYQQNSLVQQFRLQYMQMLLQQQQQQYPAMPIKDEHNAPPSSQPIRSTPPKAAIAPVLAPVPSSIVVHDDASLVTSSTSRHSADDDHDVDDGDDDCAPDHPADCSWDECGGKFDSLHQLVTVICLITSTRLSKSHRFQHVTEVHVQRSRDFACKWDDCQRERRPFKAQYMLAVHVRKHTGKTLRLNQ